MMAASRPKRPVFARPVALLVGLAEVAVLACALAQPASAQVIDERFPFLQDRARRNSQQQPGSDQPPQQRQAVDPTRPSPPIARPGVTPSVNVMVFGDTLAEWLASGLEEAFAETPEVGVVRRARPLTGLIRLESGYQSYDWPQQAKEILAAEKPDYVVMMIGVLDRRGIRELRTARAPAQKGTPPQAAAKGPATPQAQTPPAESESPPQDSPQNDEPTPAETPAPGGSLVHEFRSERWGELYGRRIDEMIVALKSRGVPVFWVGLPSIRGARAQSDMVYLNDLYRARAEKAGITYIDVWDGFVDEAGNFNQFGPDFEGQTRRLRTFDGVHFTKPGARKLAHYVEREIRRVMQSRAPMAVIPKEEPEPEPEVKGPKQAAKPIASPVMSLTAPAQGAETLLGATPTSAGPADSAVTKVLVRGEPLDAPPGRADDFVWPRRDIATSTGALPPDPVVLPPPAVVPSAPTPTVHRTVAPNAQRVQQQQQQQQQRESWWRPWGQPQQQVDPRQQQRGNRVDNNQPSFFGGWFGR